MPDSPTAFAELSNFTIHPPSVQLLQRAWCLLNHVVVLGVVDPRSVVPVTLGVLDPSDERMWRPEMMAGFVRKRWRLWECDAAGWTPQERVAEDGVGG